MDVDDSPRSGGSTPVLDEPTYHDEESQEGTEINRAGSVSEQGSDIGSPRNREINMDDDYVSDGGEVEREEVERDVGDDEDAGPASPDGFDPASADGPLSPTDSNGPMSPEPDAGPASPDGSFEEIVSPAGAGPASPEVGSRGSSPLSPDWPASPSAKSPMYSPSPARSRSGSPDENERGSPARSRSGSEVRSRSGSPRSRSASPARSRSGSPVRSKSGSPARSGSGSPRSRSGSPRSRSGSPVRSRSGSPVRSRSGSPRSRSGSPRSRSGSPVRSRSGSPRSRSGSPRSRSGSPRSRSGSPRSRSGSPRSRSRSRSFSRSRSGSPRSRSGSRSRSRSGSPRSRSASPAARSDEEKEKEKAPGSDDENDIDKDELIADIFGSSDEDEEFEGFEEADVEAAKKKKEKKKGKESKAIVSDDEEGGGVTGQVENQEVVPNISSDEEVDKFDFVSDFDLMLMKKKDEMRKRKKRRRDVDIINDNDDLIVDMIVKMKEAAEDDRALNMQKKPAITKLKMLGHVVSQLKKADLHLAFLDCGILSAMTEWLAPLPDKSLPHLQIREQFLRLLHEFPAISKEGLKTSGIGKAIMYLYKHPKETKENKDRAGKLINEWSRPIFSLTSNFKKLSKEEREERDYEQLPKKRRVSSEGMTPRRDIDKALEGEDKQLRPGDKGWINRARVPMPSHKDYVVRPKWEVEEELQAKSSGKKPPSRYDKHVRAFAEKKKFNKAQRAVTISIEGRNMAL
ncbi:IWS1-like protein [Ostrea edulis]|uniref:IWS1-like protein n=1 Tax=Ostrea edulis TaxID=37623 RepID=UPI002095BB26|nr:IWS1-like protein [Ostrea edulis]